MSDTTSTTLMTVDDLLTMPDDGWHYELVRGKLMRMTAASTRPSIVTMNVALEICGHVRRRQLGICGSAEWGFLLATDPDTVRAPDVSFVVAARIPPEGIPEAFWPGAPDLAIEVLSPSNRAGEILDKVADYLAAGTRLVWVIDPEARTATVFRLNGPTSRVGERGALDGEDVLPDFSLDLAVVWV